MTLAERTASRLVGWGLYALIGYIVLAAITEVTFRVRPEPSTMGIGLAVAALMVMTFLWKWRLALADRLGSPALKGNAACSMVCLYMSGALLAGLLLNRLLGWWWADPLAGLVLIWWIRGEANEALEAGRAVVGIPPRD